MANKFQVTDSKGQVHKRTSKDRTYTHAVVIHYAARPATTETRTWTDGNGKTGTTTQEYRGRDAYSKAAWAGSYQLAVKSAAYESKWGETEIIEAVEIKRGESQ